MIKAYVYFLENGSFPYLIGVFNTPYRIEFEINKFLKRRTNINIEYWILIKTEPL
jgi:hypothetical protein